MSTGVIRKSSPCAECRRSKLKCNRVFPCQSCIRRGCSELCPDGQKTAIRGSKALEANAEQLANRVKVLTARVQELEKAIAEKKALKSSVDTSISEITKAIGTLTIGPSGRTRYHGDTASSDIFRELLPVEDTEAKSVQVDLSYEVLRLVDAFPFGLESSYCKVSLFATHLPPYDKALHLIDLYYKISAWMKDPIPRQEFTSIVFEPVYTQSGLFGLDPHHIAILFIIFAHGKSYDDDDPNADYGMRQYRALSHAAFSLTPLIQSATVATIQFLVLDLCFSLRWDRNSSEEQWVLGGLTMKIAQGIGLHRESSKWLSDHQEQQRRRRAFWELHFYESTINHGRPPFFLSQHCDTQFPDDLEPFITPSGETELGWHAWRFRFIANTIESVQQVFSTQSMSYQAFIIEVDQKIRAFPVPSHLRTPSETDDCTWSSDPEHAMQQYSVLLIRESILLYLHRGYCARAVHENPANPFHHLYAPSVLMSYVTACNLIARLRELYDIHPEHTKKTTYFWVTIFSVCVVLGMLVVGSPGGPLARVALNELEKAVLLFETASWSRHHRMNLQILHRLTARIRNVFTAFYQGDVPEFVGCTEELALLGGHVSVINLDELGAPYVPTWLLARSRETYNTESLPPYDTTDTLTALDYQNIIHQNSLFPPELVPQSHPDTWSSLLQQLDL